jgi:iron complex outermembrane receptor protein
MKHNMPGIATPTVTPACPPGVSKVRLKGPVAALVAAGLLSSASVWAQQAGQGPAAAAEDSTPVEQAATVEQAAPVEQAAAGEERSTAGAPAAAKGQAAVVTVTGVRRSAQSAQAIKRNADGVVDSIVAEDIGKFPDNNVAETLARVTGIQIRRDSGEASAVLIRGLPDVATLLNGRELFTTTGRYVSLADIPATMLQRVDVYKSQSADQTEGGVAGIIDVRTNRPFDFKGFSLNVSARGVYADKSDKTDPQLAATVSNRWKTDIGEFGALLGLSYQRSRYHEERAFNTAPVDKSWLQEGLTAPDQVGLIPITGDRRRSAANAAVQWRPTRGRVISADVLISRDLNYY